MPTGSRAIPNFSPASSRRTASITCTTPVPERQKPASSGSDAIYNGVTIEMVGRLESASQPNSAYGIVFRYSDENNYNVFAVDGRGRYSIWVRLNGEWIELRKRAENWTPDAAIQPVGKSNVLSVSLLNETLIGYVNNRQVVRVSDASLQNGQIGIYFATDDGEALVSVDSYRVFSTIPSMTGDH